jgi:hypothetical protein
VDTGFPKGNATSVESRTLSEPESDLARNVHQSGQPIKAPDAADLPPLAFASLALL